MMRRRRSVSRPLPPRAGIAGLLMVMVAVIAPLSFYLPIWVVAVYLLCTAWSARCLRRHLAMPRAWVRVLLVVFAVTVVLLQFGTILGRDAGVSLFVLLAGLKLLELRSYRDAMVLLFLGYFLVILVFLFSQELPMMGFMLIIAVSLISVQTAMHRRAFDGGWLELLRGNVALLLQAVPLVLLLFVLFPRLEGPLWGLPEDAYRGMTGLGESMTPGNISALAQSDAVAFRVRFDGRVPSTAALYWRGPVFGRFDGRTWGFRLAPRQPAPEVTERSNPVSYSMTLEPHNKHWLLALATPAEPFALGSLSVDGELVSVKPVRERKRYRLTSFLNTRQSGLAVVDRRETSSLPEHGNPRARELARKWRALPPARRIEEALALFREQAFFYTLRPPRLGDDAIDAFLFDTRRGFCEHYAGAFTFLMRAAGLPARVVTGYQGGEYNPLGGYFLVRQRNAHAWSEVWLDGEGWRRVDPTAVIPPGRVVVPQENLLSRPSLAGSIGLPVGGVLERGVRLLTRGLDALNNRWNEWVLGYGGEQQQQFLRRLGLDRLSATEMGLALVGGVAGLLSIIAAWMFWRRGSRDPVVDAYGRYCARLAGRGLQRHAHEGPWDYYHRVAAARPAAADQARLITGLYSRLRYEGSSRRDHLQHLRRLVRRFRP